MFGCLEIVSAMRFISWGHIQVSDRHRMSQDCNLLMTYSELCAKPWQLRVSAEMFNFSFLVLVGEVRFSGFCPSSG